MLEDALRRLRVLIYLRALVVILLFGSFYFFSIGEPEFLSISLLSYSITALFFLTIFYLVILRWITTFFSFAVFAYLQLVVDVIAEIAFVSFTGGIESWFSFTFLLTIIASSIVLNRRASYSIASICSIFYGLLMEFQFYYHFPPSSGYEYSAQYYLYNVFTHILSFYIVAFLSGYLSERLHIAVETLQKKDTYIDHLKALSKDIIESMPSGIFTTDLDWKIVTFNTSAQKIIGRSSDEVIGRKPQDIFQFLSNVDTLFERVEGKIRNNGRNIFIGIRLSPLKNSEGLPIGFMGVFQDLTKVKEMEAEIREKERWAFIGELSALIAHELRNPLASLKASVEMLLERKVSERHADQLMKIAVTEMGRLNGIITDFLVYAKPRQPHKDIIDLHQSLRDFIALMRNSIKDSKDVTITGDFSGELFVTVDAKQFKQVFWNLGINAVEAIPDRGNVIISTVKGEHSVEIVFRDTGSGISEQDRERIFYPFFTTKEKGTGLGLAIAQRIVEEHGGKIKVESPEDKFDTVFRVILPLSNINEEISGEKSYGEKTKR
jgi:two-component system sensor histidine kinase PilS (NtrC family)